MTLDYQVLGTFTLLWLAIVPTPGANSLLIIHLALTSGWKNVAIALAGNLIGIAAYALATLLGLALLLTTAPSVRLAIYIFGGLYLLWVGSALVRNGVQHGRPHSGATIASEDRSHGSAFAQGILTALSNVQALFFLASIFASVGILSANVATGLAAVVVIVVCNGTYLSFLAWLVRHRAARIFYMRYRPVMEIVFGVLFVIFGARLVLRELTGWL